MSIFDLSYVKDMAHDIAVNHILRICGTGLLFGFGAAFLVCMISYVIFKFFAYLSDIG